MIVLTSPDFSEHLTPPGHPERSERAHVFDTVAARHESRPEVRLVRPSPATREEIERIHAPAYVDALVATAGRAASLDPDTFTSPASERIARLAAGAAVEAVDEALRSGEPAFALVRPPGHHAERDRAMGFCLYNNAAIGAASARARGLARVAIVDIDVHHGNGTQHSFYADPDVLYVSTHQHPFYPGTGVASETGSGAGAGYTVNVPIAAGATDDDYLWVHEAVVLPVLEAFRPELTIVSAGYDAHQADPLASMRMTASGYARIFHALFELTRGRGGFCAVTEGGYDLPALAACLDASFTAVGAPAAGAGHDVLRSSSPSPRAERAIAAARHALRSFWPTL